MVITASHNKSVAENATSDLATSYAVVNAIAAVVELRGLVSVLDLPAGR